MGARRCIFWLVPLLGVANGLCHQQNAKLSLGPLYHELSLTLHAGERLEALGPLVYHQRVEDSRLWAVPPALSYEVNRETDYEQLDVLWPVLTWRRYGAEARLQLLQLFNLTSATTQAGTNVHRLTLFPIYFQQWSDAPEQNYWALFPVHGTIRDRFFRDEIRFSLFPLYAQSRKRDVVTVNWLYPVFHVRHGQGLRGWQVWPVAGHERKEPTWKTNAWGETELVPGHEKWFALWPLFLRQESGLGSTNPMRTEAVVPLYSFQRSPGRSSDSFLWPLGLTHIIDRDRQYEEWQLAYPLIVFAHGPGKTTRRVWPLFSQAHNAELTSEWYLWPLYKYNARRSGEMVRERRRVALFLYSDARMTNLEQRVAQRRVDVWPLASWQRDTQGRERLQVLSLLEPFFPNQRGIQVNYSHLWALWRSESNAQTGARSQSLLWNLYRHESAPDRKKSSLLFGLIQYEAGPEGRRWRLFFIPVNGRQNTAPEPAGT